MVFSYRLFASSCVQAMLHCSGNSGMVFARAPD